MDGNSNASLIDIATLFSSILNMKEAWSWIYKSDLFS
jgi:hypothetical protein